MKRDSWGYALMVISLVFVTLAPYAGISHNAQVKIAFLTLPTFLLGLILAFPNPWKTVQIIGAVCLLLGGNLVYKQKVKLDEFRARIFQLEESLKDCAVDLCKKTPNCETQTCTPESGSYNHSMCADLKAPAPLTL